LSEWIVIEKGRDWVKLAERNNPTHQRLIVKYKQKLDPQVTAIPNADGTYKEWDFESSGEGLHYDEVDDPVASPDDDASYIRTDPNSAYIREDTFLFDPISLPPNATINFIRIYNRVRGESDVYTVWHRILLYVAGTLYKSPIDYHDTTWVTEYHQWNTNPATNKPWTIDEVNACEIGVEGRSSPFCIVGCLDYIYFPLRCTQVYLLVDYTVPVIVPRIYIDGFVTISTT